MKTIFLAIAVLFGLLHSARAYSLAGPVGNGGDDWQITLIGYGPPYSTVAPKNIGEEYRRNTPVLYYAYNANFLGFFGPDGMVSVDKAFGILNSLTNVSAYSPSLSEFPLDAHHINFQAQALGLYDLKTFTLGMMMEQMGLADPVQWVWTLHDRYHTDNTPPCPAGMNYLVVQRNFDITSSPLNQLQYSPYINNILYSYQINEVCTGPNALAIASPITVDPLAEEFSPVASFSSFGFSYGDYYTGLTRDDVAGLRYLLRTNNINFETAASGSLLITATTNFNAQQLFPVALTNSGVFFNGTFYGTADLGALIAASRTNDPATLQALFPGVVVATSSNYFTLATVTNFSAYFTNYIGEPAGTAPHLILATNKTQVPMQIYVNTFANVITNHYRTNTVATLQTITIGPQTGAPVGSPPVTNITSQKVTLGIPSGDYYILPTNSPCGVDIVYTLMTNVISTTNLIVSTANTNSTATNTGGSFYSQSLVTRLTNYVFVIYPVTCEERASSTELYQGIENVKFVKTSYDSLIGQFFQPVTNNYNMVYVTNSQARVQHFRRVVTAPDFLFGALDLTTGTGDNPHGAFVFRIDNPNFDTANVLPGLAGPGVINPSTAISFNKSGPVYFNSFGDTMGGTNYFIETPGGDALDLFYTEYFVWASFDGSTNAPIIFPNGTSIDNLENQILIQISPTALPEGFASYSYPPTAFTATGGSFIAPFTWSATGLPSGLTVSPDGTLAGTPTVVGNFAFTLTLTDSFNRSVQWNYPITINAP